jgi:hypothetical protein
MMKDSIGGLLARGGGLRLTSHKPRWLRIFLIISESSINAIIRIFYVKPKKINRLSVPNRFLKIYSPSKLLSGSGGLVSTVGDYARFAQMLLNGGQMESKRLLGPKKVAYKTSGHLSSLGNQTDRLYVLGVDYGGGLGFMSASMPDDPPL